MKKVFNSSRKFDLSNLKIAVLCGGSSAEAKISLKSGRAVDQALRQSGFRSLRINPKSKSFRSQMRDVDLAFIALHGEGGEDGKIQKKLQRMKVPYVGAQPQACWRSFDKALSKRIFKQKRISTPKSVLIHPRNWQAQLKSLRGPLFLKPRQEGSSFGVFGVEDFRKSAVKIKKALRDYGELLAEERILGREFTVGILAGKALPVVEVRPKRDFYDYRAKYTKGMTRYLVPAPISKALAQKMQRLALRAHRALRMRDLSRVDLMMDTKNRLYVLEINAIPGFTELSLLPKAAKLAGLNFSELCEFLLSLAWKRKKGSSNAKKKA